MVTGESISILEDFLTQRRFGISPTTDMEARIVDGFLVLQEQAEREGRDDSPEY
jgi:hypothetical protein